MKGERILHTRDMDVILKLFYKCPDFILDDNTVEQSPS
jgi:hypothetical protein